CRDARPRESGARCSRIRLKRSGPGFVYSNAHVPRLHSHTCYPLKVVRVCPRCTTETHESAQFCPECGTSFTNASDSTAATAPGNDNNPSTAQLEAEAASSNLVGMTIGNQFAVEAVIGGGAFGTVYSGRQLGLDRPVAIKVPTHSIANDP